MAKKTYFYKYQGDSFPGCSAVPVASGETERDMFAWDVARYGNWASRDFARARALDCYSHRFKIHFPNEERSAGRPARTRPAYEMQKDMGAVFGLNCGWEHPLWFAGEDEEAREAYGYERQNCFDAVARECHTLRSQVGLIDIANFAKYEITGTGARQWLDSLLANRIPICCEPRAWLPQIQSRRV